jgi:hypothetical protein
MRAILAAVILAALTVSASAATDIFGRDVTQVSPTQWQAGGTAVSAPNLAAALTTFAGMAPEGWQPPPPPQQTIISTLSFVRRFTSAERAAIRGSTLTGDLLLLMTSAQEIDVSDPTIVGGIAGLVALGLITAPRGAQVLDLSQVSP